MPDDRQQEELVPEAVSGGARPRRRDNRNRRRHAERSHTVNVARIGAAELERGRAEYPESGFWRPRIRRECEAVPRPCPYVGCRCHLWLDVSHTGNIKLNFPDLEPDEMHTSCMLDVADAGGMVLEDVAAVMNLSRERVRQIEHQALSRLVSRGTHLRELIPGVLPNLIMPGVPRPPPVWEPEPERQQQDETVELERKEPTMSILEEVTGLSQRVSARLKAIDEESAALAAEKKKLMGLQRVLWKGAGGPAPKSGRVPAEDRVPAVVEALRAGQATPKDVSVAVHGTDDAAHKQLVQHVLNVLVKSGRAKRVGRGTYRLTAKGERGAGGGEQ